MKPTKIFLYCLLGIYIQEVSAQSIHEKYNKTVKIHLAKGDTARCLKEFCLFYQKEYRKHIVDTNDSITIFKELIPTILSYRQKSLLNQNYNSQIALLCLIDYYEIFAQNKNFGTYLWLAKNDIELEIKKNNNQKLMIIYAYLYYLYGRTNYDIDYRKAISYFEYSNDLIKKIQYKYFKKNLQYFTSSHQQNYKPVVDIFKYCFEETHSLRTENKNILKGLYGLQDLNNVHLAGAYNGVKEYKNTLKVLKNIKNKCQEYGIEHTVFYHMIYHYTLSEHTPKSDRTFLFDGLLKIS